MNDKQSPDLAVTHALEQPTKANVFVVAAPSGAGKTSLVAALLEKVPGLQLSISYTTRPPRPNDIDGQDYHFVSQERFQEMLAAGEFLEHAEVYGHYYGTSKTWVQDQLNQGQDIVLEIDWQGARQIRYFFPRHAQLIFILPPSHAVLEERLLTRQGDSHKVVAERMQVAQAEIAHYKEFDYLVVNDDFALALDSLAAIVRAARLHILRQLVQQAELLDNLL